MDPKELVSVAQAREIINENMVTSRAVSKSVSYAAGLAIAEDIFSSLDLPAFDQSSMDGYAIYAKDISERLIVQGVIMAGSASEHRLSGKHAMRIFTGAPLPEGADTIIMQEKVRVHHSSIQVLDQKIERGTHVRKRGSELKKGELILSAGSIMSPAVAGLLSSLGKAEIKVYPRLTISVIATGNELQKPGKTLEHGQSYESNIPFLSAALHPFVDDPLSVVFVEDKLELIRGAISSALIQSDIILLTGGVSVGDYDFVRKAADDIGITCHFHKVKQRPGKPLYFGTKNKTLVFGLPGNPASVITCFYEYVLPAIQQTMHLPSGGTLTAELKMGFRKAEGLTQFLKGFLDGNVVEILDAQESYRLRSFARANCLVCLDEERITYEKGEIVRVRLLPK